MPIVNSLEHSGEYTNPKLTGRSSGEISLAEQMDESPVNPIGAIIRRNGNLYRYVYFVSGTTVAGAPAYIQALNMDSTDPTAIFAVTRLTTAAIDGSGGGLVAGLFLKASITAARYIWVQCGGVHTAAVVGALTAFGDLQFGGASDILVRVAQGGPYLNVPCAVALKGIAGGKAPVLILNCAW